MSTVRTVLLTLGLVLCCSASSRSQEPAPVVKVIYNARAYCTAVDNGQAINATATADHEDPNVACEEARRKIKEKYPNATCNRPCVLVPPIEQPIEVVRVVAALPCKSPWQVSYVCRASDGEPYVAIGEGCSFCEAYNKAKADAHAWVTSLNLQCCSACYQIDRQPCTCKPRSKLFGRR